MQSMQADEDLTLLAATTMPDHLHLLFTLGSKLTVGQVMAKVKSLTRLKGQVGWRWQADGFEHHLRPHELIEHYGFYLFMNPYQAGLCKLEEAWPGWMCPDPGLFQFLDKLGETKFVPREWLNEAQRIALMIATGD